MAIFGNAFGSGLGSSLGSAIGGGLLPSSSKTTQKQYLDLSPEGYNKIIKDILASDAGLAALATGENLSGGYGSSVKAQLAQDLVLNIAGEMSKLTAPTVSQSKTKKKMSVICTELERQGLLDTELYNAGAFHFFNLPKETVVGYRVWATKVIPILQKHTWIAKAIAPIAIARYHMIVHGKFNVVGAITIYIAQPICYVIGCFLGKSKENHGDLSTIA